MQTTLPSIRLISESSPRLPVRPVARGLKGDRGPVGATGAPGPSGVGGYPVVIASPQDGDVLAFQSDTVINKGDLSLNAGYF